MSVKTCELEGKCSLWRCIGSNSTFLFVYVDIEPVYNNVITIVVFTSEIKKILHLRQMPFMYNANVYIICDVLQFYIMNVIFAKGNNEWPSKGERDESYFQADLFNNAGTVWRRTTKFVGMKCTGRGVFLGVSYAPLPQVSQWGTSVVFVSSAFLYSLSVCLYFCI